MTFYFNLSYNKGFEKLQQHLNILETSLNRWRVNVNNSKFSQITFTAKQTVCAQITFYITRILYGDVEAQWISGLGGVRHKLFRFLSILLGGMLTTPIN